MKWEKVKLSDVCVSIYDGTHQAPPKSEDGVPFITISNVDKSNKIDFTDTAFVSKEYYDCVDEKRKARKGDILYTVVGSFGIPVYIKEDIEFVFQRHIAILRPNNKIDGKFLYYTMLSRDFYMQADSVALGAAQRTITLNSLRNMAINLPSLEVQQRIASILSAYDELIENNQKQIKLLEEAAQRLYKEWFVDLRFPGYENTEIVDGLPVGWELKKAIEVFDITIGRTPPRSQKECFTTNNKGIAWVSIADMGSSDAFILETNEDLTEDAVRNFNVSLVPKGTILLSFKLTVGRVAIANKELCTNEAIAHFRLDDESFTEFLYFYLKNFNYDALGNTSAISKAINSTIVKNMKIVIPDKALLDMFHNLTKPMFKKIETLQIGVKELKEARGRVLPKLMSGKVEV